MNTLWHIFWTYIIFRKKKYAVNATVFSFIPDISYLVSLAIMFLLYGLNWESFRMAFHFSFAQVTTKFFHSFAIIFCFAFLTFIIGFKNLYLYFYSWIFHLLMDMLTHVSDAYEIFWPISSIRFPSFVSYWETRHYSFELNLINFILVTCVMIYLIFKNERIKKFEYYLFAVLIVYLMLNIILLSRSPNYNLFALIFLIVPLLLFLIYIFKSFLDKFFSLSIKRKIYK